jgi:hypothetical protein
MLIRKGQEDAPGQFDLSHLESRSSVPISARIRAANSLTRATRAGSPDSQSRWTGSRSDCHRSRHQFSRCRKVMPSGHARHVVVMPTV